MASNQECPRSVQTILGTGVDSLKETVTPDLRRLGTQFFRGQWEPVSPGVTTKIQNQPFVMDYFDTFEEMERSYIESYSFDGTVIYDGVTISANAAGSRFDHFDRSTQSVFVSARFRQLLDVWVFSPSSVLESSGLPDDFEHFMEAYGDSYVYLAARGVEFAFIYQYTGLSETERQILSLGIGASITAGEDRANASANWYSDFKRIVQSHKYHLDVSNSAADIQIPLDPTQIGVYLKTLSESIKSKNPDWVLGVQTRGYSEIPFVKDAVGVEVYIALDEVKEKAQRNMKHLGTVHHDLTALGHRLDRISISSGGQVSDITAELINVLTTVETIQSDPAKHINQIVSAISSAQALLSRAASLPVLDFAAPLDTFRFSLRQSERSLEAKGTFTEATNGQQISALNEFSGLAIKLGIDPSILGVHYQTWGLYLNPSSWGDGPRPTQSDGNPIVYFGPSEGSAWRQFLGICQVKISFTGKWVDLYDFSASVRGERGFVARSGPLLELTSPGATPGGGPNGSPIKCMSISVRLKPKYKYNEDWKREDELQLGESKCLESR